MPQAVDFSGTLLNFRFIDIDISVTISLESSDFLFIPGFNESNSTSTINLPRDLFSNLFLFNLTYEDLSNSVFTKMYYAMDASNGWYNNTTSYINNTYTEPISGVVTPLTTNFNNVPFTNSVVNSSTSIIPTASRQELKYDYIRYLLKTITGNIYTNGLFRNTDQLLQNVISMDLNFNSQIITILSNCGTVEVPMTTVSYYDNPGRVLIDSILANDNVLENDNQERRTMLIDYFHSVVDPWYLSNTNTPYYINGTMTGSNISQFHYPIYLNVPANSTNAAYTPVTFSDPLLDGRTLYTSINTSYSGLNLPGATIYSYNASVQKHFFNLPFEYNDTLGVRLTYKPKNNMFLGKTINDYSYEVYMDMGLELVTDVPYLSTGDEGFPAIVTTTISPHTYTANGINTAFQYVMFNASLPFLYKSPYNFYPTLGDIYSISFQTYVTKKTDPYYIIYDGITFDQDEWAALFEETHANLYYMYNQYEIDMPTPEEQTAFDLSYNNPNNNWFFSIYCRPRNYGTAISDGVGFDRFDSVPIVKSFDQWYTFNLSNLLWKNTTNSVCNWKTLLAIPLDSADTPYGIIKTHSDQQIMIMSIGTNTEKFTGRIRSVRVTFNDGRIIQMV